MYFEIFIGYKIVAGPLAVCISVGFDRWACCSFKLQEGKINGCIKNPKSLSTEN